MANSPQSSRLTSNLNKSLFGNITAGNTPMPSYFAQKTITANGETNIQIKKKENATPVHYIIGAGILIGLVIYAGSRLD